MVERGRQPGFADKPLPELVVDCDVRGQQLQGRLAAQMDVFRQIDHPLAAAAEEGLDAVVRDRRSDASVPHGVQL